MATVRVSATSSIDYDNSDDFFCPFFFLRTYGRDNVSPIALTESIRQRTRCTCAAGPGKNGKWRPFFVFSGRAKRRTRRRAFVIIVLLNIYVDYYI